MLWPNPARDVLFLNSEIKHALIKIYSREEKNGEGNRIGKCEEY
jgi:hypothetical protein